MPTAAPPATPAVAPAALPADSAKRQPTKSEYAASVAVPQLEVLAPQRLLRIGDIDISITDHASAIEFPLYIPHDPDFWQAQYREHRRRKGGKRGNEAAAGPDATTETKPKPKPTNWAALFKPNGSAAKPLPAANSAAGNGAGGPAAGERSGRQQFTSLEDALEHWRVVLSAPPVRPRGLVNTGNMCFMNVVLQALLYCVPFCSMLWSIKENVAFSFNAGTPLLEALIQYVNEFKHDRAPLQKLLESEELEEPFVPENVYEALREKGVFQTLRGQQEDAQEFMSYLVDGIHEEMAMALLARRAQTGAGGRPAPAATPSAESGDAGWLEVGPDSRGIHMRDANESVVRTPITQIFGGTLRSTLTVAHAAGGAARGKARGLNSSTREPFQWLALDISADGVTTIEDALDALVTPESIEGYMNVQGEPVDAMKQILLERMPPVLVLHLKRFVFCADEGVQKVHKFIEYPAELSLSPDWLAKTAEAARLRSSRYRLSGVIYHHGSHASGGHYTCDILRSASEWLRFDDVDIACLDSVDDALAEKKDRTAYILFYTTCT
ncbi:hypothetical protein LPJ61_004303 [Coemansia biformis]|uniref:Ubiquitin carboxyl-terminal hydrolase n=1 Tax=Coemansia biformis TaxID=1286918 RepID=A0A9W7Y9S1_9FUNG|nr:hypothetical protein LPJ61_004303 [Coemansia biformis]